MPLDVLRLELKAGGISAEHEESVIARLRHDGMDQLRFIDFLVCIRGFKAS